MDKGPLLFMSPSCGACKSQKKILNDYFISQGQYGSVSMINVDKYPDRFKFVEVLPTWLFPLGNGKCEIKTGVLEPSRIFSFGTKRGSRFGKTDIYPGINDLQVYGKNFPNNKEFNKTDSFYKTIEDKWGKGSDTLNAGVGGTRSLGPNNIQEMYNTNYLNDIRMAHPSDQLGTALYLNRSCGDKSSNKSTGMVSGSGSPQIVDNTTGFGNKRRPRFGSLPFGPAYGKYKDIGGELYSGGRQNEKPRPNKITSSSYIGQAPGYTGYTGYKNYTVKFGKKKSKIILN